MAPKEGEAKPTFPPELTKSKCYDQRSDIFSLGCVAYELCAFAAPFEAKEEPGNHNQEKADNENERVGRACDQAYKRVPDCYSNELNDLIASMLEAD